MRHKISISIILVSMLALIFIGADAQQGQGGGSGDRDQQMDRDRTYDRDQDLDRTYDQDRDYTADRDRDQDRTRDYAASDSVDRDQDRDRDQLHGRDQDQERVQDRDRTQDMDPASLRDEDVYGSALMSQEELKQYRNQLANVEDNESRKLFQAQHEAKMQERAQQQGKDLVPPGQGPVYGGELMTVQERNQYREQLRHMDSEEERQKFEAQHREQMELRANALAHEIEGAE
jgi:hypothetical protein